MQTIYLDISNKGVIPTIYAKQGDAGRKFELVLTDSGLPYIPVGGSAFSVWYSGASGEGNYTDIGDKSAFSVNGNKVTVEMIAQMLSASGDGILSIALNDQNGNQISTWNIPYMCESVPGADSEEAQSYYTAFSRAVDNLPYPDVSLSAPGKAADAKATGDKINSLTANDVGAVPANYYTASAANGWHRAHFAKIGKMVICSLIPAANRSEVLYGTSTTIPGGFAPAENISFKLYSNFNASHSGSGTVTLAVNKDGTITVSAVNGVSLDDLSGTYCWLTA